MSDDVNRCRTNLAALEKYERLSDAVEPLKESRLCPRCRKYYTVNLAACSACCDARDRNKLVGTSELQGG